MAVFSSRRVVLDKHLVLEMGSVTVPLSITYKMPRDIPEIPEQYLACHSECSIFLNDMLD